MENASKALIMAGEVLISIIIISALVLMFNSLTSYQNVKAQNDREAEVIKFNNRYEAYNREAISGNDLFSLINQVVDYNERKSTVGEQGEEFAYQPITINVDFKTIEDRKKLTVDNIQRIFTEGNKFTINSTNNTFKELFIPVIQLEVKYPVGALSNLAKATTRIFIKNSEFNDYLNNDINKARQIIYNFNSAYGSATLKAENKVELGNSWNQINEESKIREEVFTYYEYLQFTRAHFKCTGVKYNQGTGRIVEMDFEFTGEIN